MFLKFIALCIFICSTAYSATLVDKHFFQSQASSDVFQLSSSNRDIYLQHRTTAYQRAVDTAIKHMASLCHAKNFHFNQQQMIIMGQKNLIVKTNKLEWGSIQILLDIAAYCSKQKN